MASDGRCCLHHPWVQIQILYVRYYYDAGLLHPSRCPVRCSSRFTPPDQIIYAFLFKATFKAGVIISQGNCKSEDSGDAARLDKQIGRKKLSEHVSEWLHHFLHVWQEGDWFSLHFPPQSHQGMLLADLRNSVQPCPCLGWASWCNYDIFMGPMCFLCFCGDG